MADQTQPEALRLAARITSDTDWYESDQQTLCNEAAALLRSLHAECEALRATIAAFHYHCKFGNGLHASTIVGECERVIPALAALDRNKEQQG